MAQLETKLVASLIDKINQPARTDAEALKETEANARNMAKAMSGAGESHQPSSE